MSRTTILDMSCAANVGIASKQIATKCMVVLCALFGAANAQAGLVFNFNSTGNAQVDALFVQAGAEFSNLFSDNVTLNINVQYTTLPTNVLGQTGVAGARYSYTDVRGAMVADAKSADDAAAVAHLPTGSFVPLLGNLGAENPGGAGSTALFLQDFGAANNSNIFVTNANAKALGLLSGNSSALDGSITFSNLIDWDFNPLDGIAVGAQSFLDTALHEIGHLLGFDSGVDGVDWNPLGSIFANQLNTLDLFRYSEESVKDGRVDFSADNRTKYFSIDGGATDLAPFSTGVNYGDGNQAGHWKDDWGCDAVQCGEIFPYIGIMDPTGSYGPTVHDITLRDVQAFDVIGWDLRSLEAPEPGTWALVAISLAGLAVVRKRKQA